MKTTKFVQTAIAIAIAVYVAEAAYLNLREWQREERMRDMSDEGPLASAMPSVLAKALFGQRDFLRELGSFAINLPAEATRTLQMHTM